MGNCYYGTAYSVISQKQIPHPHHRKNLKTFRLDQVNISNKTGYVRITHQSGTLVQPLLQWNISNYYIFCERVCSLSYPACNAHVQNCNLWPAQLYDIFPHYLINSMIFGKSLLSIKCVFFSIQIPFETFLILTRIQRDMIKNEHKSPRKVPIILVQF